VTCQDVADFLSDYVAAALPPERIARFEEHLRFCPTCVRFVENFRRALLWSRSVEVAELQTHQGIPEELVRAIVAARGGASSA